ncbi:hypothetical protein PS2_018252 [Malus domestica]
MVLTGVCATMVEVTVGAADRTNLSFTLTRRERSETYLTGKSKKTRRKVMGSAILAEAGERRLMMCSSIYSSRANGAAACVYVVTAREGER